jgi:hypothetical protein
MGGGATMVKDAKDNGGHDRRASLAGPGSWSINTEAGQVLTHLHLICGCFTAALHREWMPRKGAAEQAHSSGRPALGGGQIPFPPILLPGGTAGAGMAAALLDVLSTAPPRSAAREFPRAVRRGGRRARA